MGGDAPAEGEVARTVAADHEEEAEQPDCEQYKLGRCPFGMSGRTGGKCPSKHRKRCNKYLTWGDKDERGCKDGDCQFLHPTLCAKSLDLECLDENCPDKLHTRKCKRSNRKGKERKENPPAGHRKTGARPERPPHLDRRAQPERPPHLDRRAQHDRRARPEERNEQPRQRGDIPVWNHQEKQTQDLQEMGLQRILEAQQQNMLCLFQQQMKMHQLETQKFQEEVIKMIGGRRGGTNLGEWIRPDRRFF